MVPPSSGIGIAGSANVESASVGMIPKSVFWLDSRIPLNAMPSWIAQNDIDFYSNEFKRSGFRGGLTGIATLIETGNCLRRGQAQR
jgi:hypothetical protein